MHKARTIGVGGILKDYLRELEQEPEDLIGEGDNSKNQNDEGHLYFEWKRQKKKYKLMDY